MACRCLQRMAAPMAKKPRSIIAHVAGSGTGPLPLTETPNVPALAVVSVQYHIVPGIQATGLL